MRLWGLLLLGLLGSCLVSCKEPQQPPNGLAPCCVSSSSAKPGAGARDVWPIVLAALRAGDATILAKWTTPAGLASLRAGVHGEPEQVAFKRWGEGWSKWELRWKQSAPDRASASMGPEVKEHGLEFVRTPDGWKLDRWSPGE